MFKNLSTATKNIARYKFITFSTLSVLSLIFLLTNILLISLFVFQKIANYAETQPNVIIFFKINTPENYINDIKTKIEDTKKANQIIYTSDIEAIPYFLESVKDYPLIYESIKPDEPGQLPASLDIRANTIDELKELVSFVTKEKELSEGQIEDIESQIDNIEKLDKLLNVARVLVGIFLGLMFLVALASTILSIELSIRIRSEEIGIMQLVGATNSQIRTPFVMEGAVYGFISIIFSMLFFLAIFLVIYFINPNILREGQIYNLFNQIGLRDSISLVNLIFCLLINVAVGVLFGGFINAFVIRRYIR
ncbi:hypothetical protein IPJ91_02565 [bacterium]|nr:MAG: hypothetical protein IPJ91_02565 [bacterium]